MNTIARAKPNKLIGAAIKRKEDPRFLRGRGNFVDDLKRPRMLHAAFLRSDIAHGLLRAVDVSAALQVPGVVAAYTARDFVPFLQPLIARNVNPGYNESTIPILAAEKVLYVGQPIAIVIAESRHEAEDGADAIITEIEALPPVLNILAATHPGSPTLYPACPNNIYNHFHVTAGDIDKAFADADFILEMKTQNARCAAVPLEPRALVAEWDEMMNDITVWSTHQAPHVYRTGIGRSFNVPESSIRVISPDVGGGFGVKLGVYPDDVATIAASRLVGRPVKWTSDRREDLLTTLQGREQIHQYKVAVRFDGRVLGLKTEIRASNGAYAMWPYTAALDAGQASENVPGPYDIAAYERDVYSLSTNKAPMGPFRGVGRIAACFAIERAMDEIARKLGLDPLEVRRRNVIRHYPYKTIAGLTFESGSSAETLEKMAELLDLANLRKEHIRLREKGIYRGVGFAAIVEHSALGPKEVNRKGVEIVLGFETATMRVEPDGQVTVIVGTHSHGQGHETTFAQIVADELEIPLEQITVRFGDTNASAYGLGTWASRSLVYAGGAIILACADMRTKLTLVAGYILQASPTELVYGDGAVAVRADPTRQVSFKEIARIANFRLDQLPDDVDPGLEVSRRYRAPDPGSFSNSLHAAVIEVDIATGAISILRYIVIEDCGTIVNPLIVDGQIIGGVAQGLGQALMEEAHYDEAGQPTAVTLADYLLPTFSEIPRVEIHHIETPSPLSLGGFKGMGEGGAVNPPAAIANAVTDALQSFGITVNHTPITPEWIAMSVAAARTTAEA
jgi:aerobic carbon-monoxide dehydrogenase large subunit